MSESLLLLLKMRYVLCRCLIYYVLVNDRTADPAEKCPEDPSRFTRIHLFDFGTFGTYPSLIEICVTYSNALRRRVESLIDDRGRPNSVFCSCLNGICSSY